MKKLAFILSIPLTLAGCGDKSKPMSQEEENAKLEAIWDSTQAYRKYESLGAPKIWYMCNGKQGYAAGVGINATYNAILIEAQQSCSGKFGLIEGKQ
jgi:hypothetical protein